MPNSSTTPEKPQAVAACNGGKPGVDQIGHDLRRDRVHADGGEEEGREQRPERVVAHRAQQRPAFVDEIGGGLLARCGEPVENNRHGSSNSGTSRQQRGDAENLIGVAPADMVDQELRRRQQDQHAGAGGGIDHRHRGRQSRAEPAAEQDRIRHIADEGDADADAKPEAQLELPEMLAHGPRPGTRRRAATVRANRRCAARSGRTAGRSAARRGRRPARSANRPRPPGRGPSRNSPRSASGRR